MASDKASWCVYVHISPHGKYYVGITSQKNPNGRWRGGDGYKHNQHFTRAIQKYGWDNFQHEIIASNLFEAEAKNFEKLLIKKLHANDGVHGYNISEGGDGTSGVRKFGADNQFFGKHHTEETRKKMRERHPDMSGSKNPFYNKRHSDESIMLFSELGKQRAADGKKFGGYVQSPELRAEIGKLHSKPIIRYDLEMNVIKRYHSTLEAVADGFRAASIRDACAGTVETYKDSIWRYENQDELNDIFMRQIEGKIVCFDSDLNIIGKYKSFMDASAKTGVHRRHISKACRSENHYYLGKYWVLFTDCDSFLSQSVS